MIQRVQSIYLLVASVLIVLMFAFNVWEGSAVNGEYVEVSVLTTVYSLGGEVVSMSYNWWTSLLSALIALIGFGTIMLYRNRLLQIKLARMCILLTAALILLLFYYIDLGADMITAEGAETSYQVGLFFPVASIIFFFMASRAITADEKLVRSADRLR